jgi:hypothetical protein
MDLGLFGFGDTRIRVEQKACYELPDV